MSAKGDVFEPETIIAHRYRVVRMAGERVFGQVYQAEDTAMEEQVSLMRLHRGFSREAARERFFETRAAARIEHPRVVDLLDYGEDVDGRLFLVMPWLEEVESLQELLAREPPLPWSRVRAIIAQLCEALSAAHERHMIHGALAPERVLIGLHDDELHVVDFGLAAALEPVGKGQRITNTSELPGTPAYMAPELIRGEPLDERSDIYALGIIAWELVSGSPPFAGEGVEL
ncbi:MAG: serine/threonine protein kinase, partial [Myxococcales bacterium]|nr:serine/threonine protein kinase [Myxococcales bacterium]